MTSNDETAPTSAGTNKIPTSATAQQSETASLINRNDTPQLVYGTDTLAADPARLTAAARIDFSSVKSAPFPSPAQQSEALLYAVGDACPECGKPMVFDKGEEMSRDSPGEPACVYCTDCAIDLPVDWSRAVSPAHPAAGEATERGSAA